MAHSSTASTSPPAPTTAADKDKDNDIGTPGDDTRHSSVVQFGRAANASDKQTIVALVKRYYKTALAGDGAKGCSMIYSTLAEAVPEDYGQPPGPPYMLGAKTCAAALTLLFKHYHTQLALELPKLRVTRVRLLEHRGFALLSFGTMPERQMIVAREGHTWRISGLYDSELP